MWRKLCGESCCGESYVAKVAVAKFVAKVIVPNFFPNCLNFNKIMFIKTNLGKNCHGNKRDKGKNVG